MTEHDLEHIALGPPVERPDLFDLRELWPGASYDTELGVHLGPPSLLDSGVAKVPHEPHVFRADHLKIVEPDGAQRDIEDVTILLAHGYRKDGQWVFDDGRQVSGVVTAYNQQRTDKIGYLLVCNPAESAGNKQELKDLTDQHVGFAVGSNVGVTVQPVIGEGSLPMEIHAAVTLQDATGQFISPELEK